MALNKKLVQHLLLYFSAIAGGILMALAGAHLYLSPSLPAVESLRDIRLQTPLRIYSADNKLIGEFGEKRRIPISIEKIPQFYIDALLAIEDDQFYAHHGVSITGLLRATSHLLLTGDKKYGGSTITMQVARNFFLHKRKKFRRKFNEILLALKIEKELSKEEILELYVNVVFLGNRAHGIQAAAQVYYGQTLDKLNYAQLSMIAGLAKAPSAINPLANRRRALDRRNLVLRRMAETGKITQETLEQTLQEPITAKYHGNSLDLEAPHIAEMARKEAIDRFGVAAYTDGYQIHTTIQTKLQASAQKAVIKGLLRYDTRHGYRGPEQNLIPTLDSAASPTAEIDDLVPDWQQEWQKALESIPTYADLIPAAVIAIHTASSDENTDSKVHALLKDGTEIQVRWKNGISSARPYINENRRGRAPKSANEVVKLGDVVRVQRMNNDWHFSQVPAAQAALVSLDAHNGAILSLIGGFDFQQSHFNRAFQAKRQVGSNFKPFIYTTALERDFTAASLINDAPFVQEDELLESTWRPENSNHKFNGPTRLRKALYGSVNLVSVRVLKSLGISSTIKAMARFGFDSQTLPRDLTLALGSHSALPVELATGYATFANGGYKISPYFIERILNADGDTLYRAAPTTVCEDCKDDSETLLAEDNMPFLFDGDPFNISQQTLTQLPPLSPRDLPRAERVIDERTSYIIDSMLRDVVKYGTGRRAKTLNRDDLAGKTGTTNDATDAWFSGYAGGIVTTTWVGFDDNSRLGRKEYGGSAALPIWIDFMRTALERVKEKHRELPQELVTLKIDPYTGKRARMGDPDAIFEIFKSENVPAPLPEQTEDDSMMIDLF